MNVGEIWYSYTYNKIQKTVSILQRFYTIWKFKKSG